MCKTEKPTLLLLGLQGFTKAFPAALLSFAEDILDVEYLMVGPILQVPVGLKYNISPAICT